jgi:TrmH family RNA methyltransferase
VRLFLIRIAAFCIPAMLIDSPANTLVKTLRSLEQAKGRAEHRLFLVEGVRAVEDGLRSGRWPSIALYNADLLRRTERGSHLLKELTKRGKERDRKNMPVEATERALGAVSATQHPQGIVAAFPFLDWSQHKLESDGTPLALIADNIQDPGNLGTILRTAEAAGVQGVWLSPGSVDQYNPKVVRAAMGAHFRLPIFTESWAEIAEHMSGLAIGRERICATESGSVDAYDEVDWREPSALIVSNEAHGSSREARALAGRSVSIPMAGGTESLNAATAAAVILFEAARQRRMEKARD